MKLVPMRCLFLFVMVIAISWPALTVTASVPPATIHTDREVFYEVIESGPNSFIIYIDTLPKNDSNRSVFNKRERNPRTAAIRSAILPGLGQIYNRKWWKLPLVYGAIGATGYIFFYNLQWYNRTRYATNVLINEGPTAYEKVHRQLQPFVQNSRLETLRYYRNSYRRDIDYAALFFLLAWALNVVDATVDAHLSSFDVSPDLSFKIKPGYSDLAKTNGVSFVLQFK
jgi:hypothetical protein